MPEMFTVSHSRTLLQEIDLSNRLSALREI